MFGFGSLEIGKFTHSLKRERKSSKANIETVEVKKAKSLENQSHRKLGQSEEERQALQEDALRRQVFP